MAKRSSPADAIRSDKARQTKLGEVAALWDDETEDSTDLEPAPSSSTATKPTTTNSSSSTMEAPAPRRRGANSRPARKSTVPPSRVGKVSIRVDVDPELRDRLKILAIEEKASLQYFLEEAIGDLLKKIERNRRARS